MGFELLCMSLIALVIGLAVCFNGYRWFLVLLPILGFFWGFGLGTQTLQALFGIGFVSTVSSWIVGFIVGLIFAVLSYLFYIVGVAIMAGSFGYTLGVGFMGLIGIDLGILSWIVGVVAGVIAAIATLVLNIQKWVIIALTSLGGAGDRVGIDVLDVAPDIGDETESLRLGGDLAEGRRLGSLDDVELALAGLEGQCPGFPGLPESETPQPLAHPHHLDPVHGHRLTPGEHQGPVACHRPVGVTADPVLRADQEPLFPRPVVPAADVADHRVAVDPARAGPSAHGHGLSGGVLERDREDRIVPGGLPRLPPGLDGHPRPQPPGTVDPERASALRLGRFPRPALGHIVLVPDIVVGQHVPARERRQ